MASSATAEARVLSPAPAADVAEFLREHGTAYHAESDGYQRDPLVVHGKHGKASAIYNAHAYHTKVPPDAIRPYIEHYTRPGDVVLDPFCGSGMTGVAALLTGRNAILSDLSPAAVHIAYNYCTPVEIEALRREWLRIKSAVADEFAWLYGTRCDSCGGGATTQYTVWSDVLACPRCQGEIVLWDAAIVRDERNGAYDPPLSGLSENVTPATTATAGAKTSRGGAVTRRTAGDVLDVFTCPGCRETLKKTNCAYLRSEPVLTSYDCDGLCRPKRRERATSSAERARIREIAATELPYWAPETPFDPKREMWRGVHRDQGIERVRNFWTPRNLWALASLWSRASAVEDERLARALRFVITSFMLRASKMYKYMLGGTGITTGTLYVPSLNIERNVLTGVSDKADSVVKCYRSMRWDGIASAACASAALLPVPDGTLDYVFTDPPFGSNIFYSDCSLLWEAWLGELTDEAQEAV